MILKANHVKNIKRCDIY